MIRSLGRWFGPKPLNVDEPSSELDGWSLPDEFPRQTEPVASWLDDVGELPYAVMPEVVVRLDSHDLLETIPEEVHAPAPVPTEQVVAAFHAHVVQAAPAVDFVATVLSPPVVDVAPVVDLASVDLAPVAYPEPSFDPLLDGLDVPRLTPSSGRAWFPVVAGGIAIVCAVIGIFAAG